MNTYLTLNIITLIIFMFLTERLNAQDENLSKQSQEIFESWNTILEFSKKIDVFLHIFIYDLDLKTIRTSRLLRNEVLDDEETKKLMDMRIEETIQILKQLPRPELLIKYKDNDYDSYKYILGLDCATGDGDRKKIYSVKIMFKKYIEAKAFMDTVEKIALNQRRIQLEKAKEELNK